MITRQPSESLSEGVRAHIGLDCRLAGTRHAGIGRYILNLAQRLPREAPDFSFTYFISEEDQREEIDLTDSLAVQWLHTPVRHYSVAEQWQFPRFLEQTHLDLLHVPHFNVPLTYQGKLVVTIHDLLWHEYRGTQVTTLPAWQYWIKYGMYRLTVSRTVQKAAEILVPSEAVKKTLIKHYPQVKTKTTVTYEGVSTTFKPVSPRQLKLHQLLYIGSLYPHKNLEVVLHSLVKLPAYTLVIVGARDAFAERITKKIKELDLSGRVTLAGYKSDQELNTLIAESVAVVQPSFSEGFGLTGLEAMSGGGVVLASDIPVFKEIYGEAAEYFDPKSPDSFAQALKKITPARRKTLQQLGLSQLKKYSWDIMTSQTVAAYRKALKL